MRVYFENEDEIKKATTLTSLEFFKIYGKVYCEKPVYHVNFSFRDGWRHFNTTTSVDEAIKNAKLVLDERSSVTVEIKKCNDYVEI